MGRLVDQDYLWLRDSSAYSKSATKRRRWLPFVLIPIAGISVWYAFYTNPDFRPTDEPLADDASGPAQLSNEPTLVPAMDDDTPWQDGALIPVNRSGQWPAPQDMVSATARDMLPGNGLTMAPASSLTSDATRPGWHTLTVAEGDTLSLAFERQGLSYMDSLRIAHLPELGHFFTRGLKAGRTLQIKADAQGRVEKVIYGVDAGRTVTVTRDGDQFTASLAQKALDHRRATVSGVIRRSFYQDARNAGLSGQQVARLNEILSHNVDFGRDIHKGDRFVVTYDELYTDGQRVGTGPIMAVSLATTNGTVRAVRYTDSQGKSEYYWPDGRPLQRAFRRAPVDYTRISSPFNLNRRHPILRRIRRHEGTDYAAPQGAPIYATGAGRVIFRGRRGGYGNVVILRHNQRVTMRFAHMSRFAEGLSVGDTVEEGQVIGYVGMSGLATGPHVHYEFRTNGRPQNPQTVELPGAVPLRGQALARFKNQTQTIIAQLSNAEGRSGMQVANAASETRN